jgi:hypothetical protein
MRNFLLTCFKTLNFTEVKTRKIRSWKGHEGPKADPLFNLGDRWRCIVEFYYNVYLIQSTQNIFVWTELSIFLSSLDWRFWHWDAVKEIGFICTILNRKFLCERRWSAFSYKIEGPVKKVLRTRPVSLLLSDSQPHKYVLVTLLILSFHLKRAEGCQVRTAYTACSARGYINCSIASLTVTTCSCIIRHESGSPTVGERRDTAKDNVVLLPNLKT